MKPDTIRKVGIGAVALILILGVGAISLQSGNSTSSSDEVSETEAVEGTEDGTDGTEEASLEDEATEASEESDESEASIDVPDGYEECDTSVASGILRGSTWKTADKSTYLSFTLQAYTTTTDGKEEKWSYRITEAYQNADTGSLIIVGVREAWTGSTINLDNATSFTIETRGPSDEELESYSCSVVLESEIFDEVFYDNVDSTNAELLAEAAALSSDTEDEEADD